MVHVQATIPFLPANAPVGTQVPGFSTMPFSHFATYVTWRILALIITNFSEKKINESYIGRALIFII